MIASGTPTFALLARRGDRRGGCRHHRAVGLRAGGRLPGPPLPERRRCWARIISKPATTASAWTWAWRWVRCPPARARVRAGGCGGRDAQRGAPGGAADAARRPVRGRTGAVRDPAPHLPHGGAAQRGDGGARRRGRAALAGRGARAASRSELASAPPAGRRRPTPEAPMLFMVIETFRDDDMIPVYERLRNRGRGSPRGCALCRQLDRAELRALLPADGDRRPAHALQQWCWAGAAPAHASRSCPWCPARRPARWSRRCCAAPPAARPKPRRGPIARP